ncbi:TonB-dependent receptor [Pseudomonadales bacterium]|nr:TonB-dependent receptor [Pseudomonadales bacterium]
MKNCYSIANVLGCLLIYLAGFSAHTLAATEPTSEIKEIIVTGINRMLLLDLPRSATVISSEDIALSAARNIAELLAQQANIVLKSYSGNSKFTSIDLRGSGDTSVSNILILIDGIRINAPDLSGPDFSILALSQIERIEIIRGGNSVRYGSGASHGVINIFTLEAEQGLTGLIKLDAGNFATQSQQATVSVSNKKQSLTAYASRASSDGYREHNHLDSQDFLLNYRADIGERWSIDAKSYAHNDNYQLPGGLDRNSLSNTLFDRRDGSVESGAEGETDDKSQLLKVSFQASEALTLSSAIQLRERSNQFIFGDNFKLTAAQNRDRINQHSLFGELIAHWHSPNHVYALTLGFEKSNGNYSRTNGGQKKIDGLLNSGKLNGQAHFIHSTIVPVDDLTIGIGYRKEKSTNLFQQDILTADETSPTCDTTTQATDLAPPFDVITFKSNCPLIISELKRNKNHWKNEAYEASLVYAINASANIYSSFAETFRNPNIDELVLSPPELAPQRAERYETGIKYAGNRFAIDIAYFYFRTEQEILFRASTNTFGLNINAPADIIRQGGELQTRFTLSDSLELTSNLGYIDAITEQDARIPLVPFVTAAANLLWQPSQQINGNISIRHTGAREDGNSNLTDTAVTQFEKLPSHTLVDASIRLSQTIQRNSNSTSELIFSLGIQNIFNKEYSDIAYSNTIYPAATRNYFGSISYAF